MPKRALPALAFCVLLAPALSRAQGGPPMITDDPGTPGNRNWEINTAGIAALSSRQKLDQIPYIDANYGLGDALQLKVEGGYGIDLDGTSESTGLGSILAGVKWRFLDEKDAGLSVSTYPQFDFHSPFSSKNPGLAAPGNQWLIPLEFSKSWGPWALNPEIGYQYFTQSPDAWFYGLVGEYELRGNLDFLAEVHGDTFLPSESSDLLFNAGLRYPFSNHVILLASAGRLFKIVPGENAEHLGYLGLQFLL